jgi:hypothetical protein
MGAEFDGVVEKWKRRRKSKEANEVRTTSLRYLEVLIIKVIIKITSVVCMNGSVAKNDIFVTFVLNLWTVISFACVRSYQ